MLLAGTVLVGGCSLAGTWSTVRTDPADAGGRSPFQMVTFNDEGGYTATGQEGSKVITKTGAYEWNGSKLTIRPADGEVRVYTGHINILTKQLVLTHKMDGQKITAWMERIE